MSLLRWLLLLFGILLIFGCTSTPSLPTQDEAYQIAENSQNCNIYGTLGDANLNGTEWRIEVRPNLPDPNCQHFCIVDANREARIDIQCGNAIIFTMTEQEARDLAEASDCGKRGSIISSFHDSITGLWWMYLNTSNQTCSPSCIVDEKTNVTRYEPGCTVPSGPPDIQPQFDTLNLSSAVTHADQSGLVFLDVDDYSLHPAYFVATNGNDENTGTKESPFATITHALEVAKDGNAVLVRSGTYRTDTLVITQSSFVLAAYANESVTLKRSNDNVAIRIDGPVHEVTVDRINIDGFDNGIIYGHPQTQKGLIFKNLNINNVVTGIENDYPEHTDYLVDRLLVKNVVMNNVTGMGINCGDEQNKCAKNVLIRGVRVYGADNPEDFTGSDSLAMVSSDNILVLGSTFTNAPGDAMDFKATRVSIVNCVAGRPNRNGIKLWHDGEIINTIVYDTGADAAVVFDPGADGTEFRMINSIVARHSIRSPPDDRYSYAMTFGYDLPGKSRIEIKNSIIYDMPGPIFINNGSTLDIRNNIFYQFIHEDGIIEYGDEKIYNVEELNSKSYAKNNLFTDPMFTNPVGHDFTLKDGSPAIDGGMSGSGMPDFAQNRTSRPKGSGIDIGPYEG